MSSLSRRSRPRVNTLQSEGRAGRDASRYRRKEFSREDAYSYALRSAFLTYLLQPRQKRLQHVAGTSAPKPPQGSSAMELLRDFGGTQHVKSNKLPHEFMKALDKRVTNVLIGKETTPGFNEASIKRSFGVFLNEFKDPQRRKNLERDRKMEDLLLTFYSNCVKELQRGKAADDDSWKYMADRHLAMFIRLISAILKANDWAREKPELASRLQNLERKLLMHDVDLSSNGSGSHTIEVEVPLSYELKDMPQALVVSRIFGYSYGQVQEDINHNKAVWTEEAALKDLKMYQQSISIKVKNTINAEDFDTDEAYEAWKKNETQEVSNMMLNIMQTHPSLAKTATGVNIPQLQHKSSASTDNTSPYENSIRRVSDSDDASSFSQDPTGDMSSLSLTSDDGSEIIPFIFIPPEPRTAYRLVAKEVIRHNINEPDEGDPIPDDHFISHKSEALLEELSQRWRIPIFSRRVLFLEAIKDLYVERDVGLQTVDVAFNKFKEVHEDKKKAFRRSVNIQELVAHWRNWTLKDIQAFQQCLLQIREHIMRDLFQIMQNSYDQGKGPSFGMFLVILQNHIDGEELLPNVEENDASFAAELSETLKERASEAYQSILASNIPAGDENWDFLHVINLGQAVMQFTAKIEKRFSRASEILGARPITVFVAEILPCFAEDARDLVGRIIQNSKTKEEEIAYEDGFALYEELVKMRAKYKRYLPQTPFIFHIEDHLQEFVWKYIQIYEENAKGWMENAVKQDQFIKGSHSGAAGPDDRHSSSAVDIFRTFNQGKTAIIALEWDHPFQNAKFMTTIARIISQGVETYCKMLETRFTHEMEKQSIQEAQEAAPVSASESKWQDNKWLSKMSKNIPQNLWKQTERAEPFQFASETLVKLNNIEYVMLNLDKLEAQMDVDRHAQIVRAQEDREKRARGNQRVRKQEKFVFTIKIVEAEDLKPCDMNGLSDPYLVLGDEFQKRITKTKICYATLNPRWDETLDLVVSGPLNLVATVWDWDQLGDHDCCGRTTLKLDPNSFRDYLPQEFWIDLDTQGRVLMRVSMEGERDDIEFHFGKAFRQLKRTERDMTRMITDKLSKFIQNVLSRKGLQSLTNKGVLNSLNSIGFLNRARAGTVTSTPVTQQEVEQAIAPLYSYFDENFAIMKQTLTDTAMIMVMTRVWKETLLTIEALLVPPMSDKTSQQRPLTQQEFDIVFKWLDLLLSFFHAVDEETGEAHGIPLDILKSPKYREIVTLNFFYFQPTNELIRTSEDMAAQSAQRHQEATARLNRMSAPANLGYGGGGSRLGGSGSSVGAPRRRKTVLLSRNLGTMRQAKEEKRKMAQAEPTDEYILRILRMRPEAERYLKDRSRQKARLAAQEAAEAIVRESLAGTMGVGGGGRPPLSSGLSRHSVIRE